MPACQPAGVHAFQRRRPRPRPAGTDHCPGTQPRPRVRRPAEGGEPACAPGSPPPRVCGHPRHRNAELRFLHLPSLGPVVKGPMPGRLHAPPPPPFCSPPSLTDAPFPPCRASWAWCLQRSSSWLTPTAAHVSGTCASGICPSCARTVSPGAAAHVPPPDGGGLGFCREAGEGGCGCLLHPRALRGACLHGAS